jgi:selenide,water dikinase
VLVDASTGDDAAVVKMADGRALVLTTDFFTPIVDDARDFGRIAAANALSDVYAMGGTPKWCLSIVGWPRETLPLDLLGEVLQGASDIVREAGAVIVGGHSIDDPEPKFGLMVVGEVDPGRMMTNAAARPGDVLILTKPLGTGIITTAIKREAAGAASVQAAIASMTTLNAAAAAAAVAAGVRAATDVTGFGLVGHLSKMMAMSGCAAELEVSRVPLLPGLEDLVRQGHVPGGTSRNLDAVADLVEFGSGSEALRPILADPQTSGGLLLCAPAPAAGELAAKLEAPVIGRVVPGRPGHVAVRP